VTSRLQIPDALKPLLFPQVYDRVNAAITIQFQFKFDCVLIISRIVDVEPLDRMLAGGVLTKDL
jgi:hypothetical protein